ncbi:MAG TPA: alpha-2-macroglobulin family protein, partial [Fimbriimonadaceae bacterium]|nr:alpha-2-macroglobulin family protein [Fimbriimonadaceae bacterium]
STVMVASHGGSRAFVDFYAGEPTESQTRIYAYTDRPIYRPGDEISFKGVARTLVGSSYQLPQAKEISVEVRDNEDSLIEKMRLPLSSMGTYSGSFRVNKEAAPGNYSIVASIGSAESYTSVSVAAYRKPAYTIKVRPEKPYYVRGERVRMIVEAEYYFGGPVPGAKINASAYREPYWDPGLYAEEADEFLDEYNDSSGYGGEFFYEEEARTDENGRAVLEFPTAIKDDRAFRDNDFRYNMDVSVVDEGGKYYSGAGSVRVMRGDFALRVDTDRYAATAGESVQMTVKAVSHEGDRPIPNLPLKVVSGNERWDNRDMVMINRRTQEIQTGPDGTATFTVQAPRGGSFKVDVEAKDHRGNEVVSTAYLWISGEGEGESRPANQLSLLLDKKSYKEGETAKVIIQTDRPGGSALLSVEGDRVYSARAVALTGTSTTVSIPVTKDLAPNAFVSVAYVKDKKFAEANKRLAVDLGVRKLNVSVTPGKDRYLPGETATYTIDTKRPDGKGTPAEVSLAVVDESIFALAPDRTDILTGFYPKRYDDVQTHYSFPELYLDGGDKAPTSIEVRRKFMDTAAWLPAVRTDDNGRATLSVKLPDNLTTWRATAVGVTRDTSVGMASSKVIAQKDLMVRLEAPTYLVRTDEQRMAAVVSNGTGSDLDVKVQIESSGAQINGGKVQSVRVPAGSTRSVEYTVNPDVSGTATFVAKAWVDNGPTDGVELKVPVQALGRLFVEQTAGNFTGSDRLTVNLRDGADLNSGRLLVGISPTIAPALLQSLDELVNFPYGCTEQTMSRFMPTVVVSRAMTTAGLPRPRLADQIPAMVADGLTRHYRMQHSDGGWGWWENDESEPFMTAYVLEGLLRAKQAGFKPNQGRIDRAVQWAQEALKKPLPEITASDVEWAKVSRDRAISDRIYLAYALALYDLRSEAGDYIDSAEARENTSPAALAHRILTLATLGDRAEELQSAIDSLEKAAVTTGATAHWQETYWGVESTAKALNALTLAAPDSPLIRKIVQYLMSTRRGYGWWSTRDTAFALLGLSRYLERTKELLNPADMEVLVNGTVVQRVQFTAASIAGPTPRIEVPLSGLQSGANTVELRNVTGGIGYYTLDMRQVVAQERLPELVNAAGLQIERRYFRLSTERLEDGTMKLLRGKSDIDSADKGDLIRCVLTIKSDKAREFLLIEDPVPSSCRVMERETLAEGEEWDWWFSSISIFDSHVAFFARSLEAGETEITYTMRVENPGKAHALPATIYNMYEPEVRSSSAGGVLQVSR